MLLPENAVAWDVWARYGWTLIAWDSRRFLLAEAMGLLATLGVEDVDDELFKLSQIASAYINEAVRKLKQNE